MVLFGKVKVKKAPKIKQKSLDTLFKDALKTQRGEGKAFDKKFTELTVSKVVRVKNTVL